MDTLLNRVLTPAYFEELLAEMQTQFEDTKAIDQEITDKQAALREIEQAIHNLLALAEPLALALLRKG